MPVVLMTLVKSIFTEWVVKRLTYLALQALSASSKNTLDDKATFLVGQALGLEKMESTDGES